MIENTAFKLFEVWWDEKKSEKNQTHGGGENAIINNTAKEDVKPQALSSLLEQATPLGLNYDGFGLGIRASMPKMPSFRVGQLFYLYYTCLCISFRNNRCYVFVFYSARSKLQAHCHKMKTVDNPVMLTWKQLRAIAI